MAFDLAMVLGCEFCYSFGSRYAFVASGVAFKLALALCATACTVWFWLLDSLLDFVVYVNSMLDYVVDLVHCV